MNKVLSHQDIGTEKCCCNEKELFLDMTDFSSVHRDEIMKHKKPLKIEWSEVTILDFYNFPCETDEQIIQFIKTKAQIDINTPEGIKKFNLLINQAIELYKNRYLRRYNVREFYLKGTQEILKFIRSTKESKRHGLIHCAILKIGYSIENVMSNEKINRAEFLDEQFISQHLSTPFQIEKTENINGSKVKKWKVVLGESKIIKFTLTSRQKWPESMIGKSIAQPKYHSVDEFKDLVGATIYVETQEEALLMMQYIDQMIYKWEAEISNKDAIQPESLENSWLNEEFRKKCIEAMVKAGNKKCEKQEELQKRKKSTSITYKEVKLIGKVELAYERWQHATTYPVGTEVKFVIWKQDNESWIALQAIYDYQKKFTELTRLGLPIREVDILNYVNDFFDNLDNILKKVNKNREDYFEELFSDLKNQWDLDSSLESNDITEKVLAFGLYHYFTKNLVKIKIPHSKNHYYFEERAVKLDKMGMMNTQAHVQH